MMKIRLCVLASLAFACAWGPVEAAADDRVVGAVWDIGVKVKKGRKSKVFVRRFRATGNGKVWNTPRKGVPRVIGHWQGTWENTKLVIHGPLQPENAKFKGNYEFALVRKKPPTWRGTFRAQNGRRFQIAVRLVKD